jgi:hypothetical protein
MSTITTPSFSERHCRAIERILETMERTAPRADKQYSGVRKHTRKSYAGPLSVYFPTAIKPFPPTSGNDGCVAAWAYNLSQGGVGMIMLEQIPGPQVWVGVHQPNRPIRWLIGEVTRCRIIPEEEFFDCGVRFIPMSGEEHPA